MTYENHNLNNSIRNEAKIAVQKSDWDEFSRLRYFEGDVGCVCYIEDLDLSNRNLGDIPGDFLCFKNCNLDNASFSGKHFFPLSIWDCSAKGLDLRDSGGMLFVFESDLTNSKFDESTQLVVGNTSIKSCFVKCKLDKDFKEFLKSKDVNFIFPKNQGIEYMGFGVKPDSLI
jgi:hypothetical protein